MRQFNLKEFQEKPYLKLCDRKGREVTITYQIPDSNCITYMAPTTNTLYGWYPRVVGPDGRASENENNDVDLMFRDEPHHGWIYVYKDNDKVITSKRIYPSKQQAIEASKKVPLKVLCYKRINWTE